MIFTFYILFLNLLLKLLEIDGLAEIISLKLFAANFLEEIVVFLCFHPLGKGVYPQLLRHPDYSGNNLFPPVVQILQKCHIYFYFIKIEVLQHI